jgi:hypothetical protein
MALRVLSGFVKIGDNPGPKNGRVAIRFSDHQLIDGDATIVERRTIGPEGRFVATPAKHVALRQITLIGVGGASMPNYTFRLGDEITRDDLVITWNGSGPAFSEEVSYMVVGEVPDPRAPIVGRRPIRPVRSKPAGGKSRSSRAKRR